jgi:peptide/nickel transport system substrate-binding protein
MFYGPLVRFYLSRARARGRPRARGQTLEHDPLRLRSGAREHRPVLQQRPHRVIIGAHVWDTLVYRDPVSGEYKGQLATGWRQVDDKTIEFDLRRGVKFHDGQEFTADDVVYTLNFVAKPENKVVTQANVSWIDRAEKIDAHKVRVVTKQVFPAAIEYLAGPVVIHPQKYYEAAGPKGQNEKPVGSGPYRVTSHVIGKS